MPLHEHAVEPKGVPDAGRDPVVTTVAEYLVSVLAAQGTRTVWGVVGDALNPVTDAIRREDRLDWIGVRHEEVAAFAAGAQAQLTGTLGVCMGTVGPGSVHLLNGLYDARKSHAPVLAICGQVPLAELGTDFFQEVDNDLLFRDVAAFTRTITSPEQVATLLEQALQAALNRPGVAVLTLPGDVGGLDMPKHTPAPRTVVAHPPTVPGPDAIAEAAALIDRADKDHDPRRDRRARRARRTAGDGGAAAGADGALAQGQAGPGARQPVPGGAERAHRQPGRPGRVRGVRPAAARRHRLPVPRVVPGGQDGDPDRRPAPSTSAGVRTSTSVWSGTARQRCRRCSPASRRRLDAATSTPRARSTRPGSSGRRRSPIPTTTRAWSGASGRGSTTPRTASGPRRSPRRSTGTRPTTPCSRPIPAW